MHVILEFMSYEITKFALLNNVFLLKKCIFVLKFTFEFFI
jgi:hypothetical protein